MGNSPGEPCGTPAENSARAGQVFVGDYSRFVARASLEKVAGAGRARVFRFSAATDARVCLRRSLKAGATRAVFAPDGSLYLGATAGWGAGEDGLQRVRWDSRAAPRFAT